MLRFDRDERKNKSNRIKHGPFSSGASSAGRMLVVSSLLPGNDSVVRIISARKATGMEVRFYEEGI
jgi:uncharacterized DUF497 family protein